MIITKQNLTQQPNKNLLNTKCNNQIKNLLNTKCSNPNQIKLTNTSSQTTIHYPQINHNKFTNYTTNCNKSTSPQILFIITKIKLFSHKI